MIQNTLSIVLPCYNPDSQWCAKIVTRYKEIQQELYNYKLSLIIVNDGSNHSLANDIAFLKNEIEDLIYLDNSINKGKGHALRTGINEAQSDLIIYTDVDFPYTNESLRNMVLLLEQHDIIIGIRGNSYYNNIPAHRKMISKLLKYLIKTTLSIPTDDTQGGLKGMRKSVKNIFLQTEINRYLFDLEFVCLCTKNKLNIGLLPVSLNENTVVNEMNFKAVSKEILNFIKVYFKMLK